MKSAFVESVKTFFKQVKANSVELAKKTVEHAGYTVKPKKEKASK